MACKNETTSKEAEKGGETCVIECDKYNFEIVVRHYAKEHDESFQKTMRFLSSRRSLEVACEILGIKVLSDHPTQVRAEREYAREILRDFSDFLMRNGYKSPSRMWERNLTRG